MFGGSGYNTLQNERAANGRNEQDAARHLIAAATATDPRHQFDSKLEQQWPQHNIEQPIGQRCNHPKHNFSAVACQRHLDQGGAEGRLLAAAAEFRLCGGSLFSRKPPLDGAVPRRRCRKSDRECWDIERLQRCRVAFAN